MSCMYGLHFAAGCRYEMRGRTVCNCSTRISGTGYMFPAEFVKNGWEYVTLTEDWEFTADNVASGVKIYHCDEAEFFDEQPTTTGIMLRQRFRWARGHMLVFFTRFKKLVTSFFNPRKHGGEKKNLVSKYDMSLSIMPLGVITLALTLLQPVLLAFCPLFGYNAAEVFISYLTSFGIALAMSYATTFLAGTLLFILEHKRLKGAKFFTVLGALFLLPVFWFIAMFMDIVSLFKKKVEWKPIPHYGKTTNKTTTKAEKQN